MHPSDNRPNDEAQAGAFLFTREVPVAGYALRQDVKAVALPGEKPDAGTTWFVDKSPVGTPRSVTLRYPLAESALHRQFADLGERDDRRYRKFVSDWGLLGRSQRLVATEPGPQRQLIGESLERWRSEARTMKRLTGLWDLAQGGDVDLEGRVVWATDESDVPYIYVDWGDQSWETIAREAHPPINAEALASWEPPAGSHTRNTGDLAAPARYHVCQRINRAMQGHVSLGVSPYESHELAILPRDLLAALYVQFAMEVSGRTRGFKECAYCGTLFVPSRRSDQRYCSASCRKKHHYHEGKGAR